MIQHFFKSNCFFVRKLLKFSLCGVAKGNIPHFASCLLYPYKKCVKTKHKIYKIPHKTLANFALRIPFSALRIFQKIPKISPKFTQKSQTKKSLRLPAAPRISHNKTTLLSTCFLSPRRYLTHPSPHPSSPSPHRCSTAGR